MSRQARMHRKKAIVCLVLSSVAATGLLVVGRDRAFREWVDSEIQQNPRDPRAASVVIDCTAEARPISPLIYGVGGIPGPWTMGITARRHGGNPTSRYNWELDTHNAGSDWFFKNAGGEAPGNALEPFLSENFRHNVK